jgi:hypothetical protein
MTDSPSRSWHEVLNLQPTNVDNFYSRPKPPGRFSPLTATADELARSGFPPRPDPEQEPAAYMRWRRRYGRALSFIEPELVIRPHRPRGPLAGPSGTGVSSNWAGSVVDANEGQQFLMIHGSWIVPCVSPPATGPYSDVAPWSSVAWVGLDGAGISADVFQAGTEQDSLGVDFAGFVDNYFVWTEWFPAPPAAVTSLPVEPGHMIDVTVMITSLDVTWLGIDFPVGEAFFVNNTLGLFTSVMMAGPVNFGPTPFMGNTAEWIAETPCTSNCGTSSAVFEPLPFFGQLAFFDTFATDADGNVVNGMEGIMLSMDNSGDGPGRNGGAPGTGIVVAAPDPVVVGIFCDSIGVDDS